MNSPLPFLTLAPITLEQAVASYEAERRAKLPNIKLTRIVLPDGGYEACHLDAYKLHGRNMMFPAQALTEFAEFSYQDGAHTYHACFCFDSLNNRWTLGAD